MKRDPIQLECTELLLRPDAGAQELPVLILKFANGRSVSVGLTISKYRRLRTVGNAAHKYVAAAAERGERDG